jgi:hypothetical protein
MRFGKRRHAGVSHQIPYPVSDHVHVRRQLGLDAREGLSSEPFTLEAFLGLAQNSQTEWMITRQANGQVLINSPGAEFYSYNLATIRSPDWSPFMTHDGPLPIEVRLAGGDWQFRWVTPTR